MSAFLIRTRYRDVPIEEIFLVHPPLSSEWEAVGRRNWEKMRGQPIIIESGLHLWYSNDPGFIIPQECGGYFKCVKGPLPFPAAVCIHLAEIGD